MKSLNQSLSLKYTLFVMTKCYCLNEVKQRKSFLDFGLFLVVISMKVGFEGTSHWMKIVKMMTLENVFEPVKYYFKHVLVNKSGIIYNMSEWNNTKLVRVLSETIDNNS